MILNDANYYPIIFNSKEYDMGIPLRLKLAESAMIGLLSNPKWDLKKIKDIVKYSFDIADVMIEKYNEDLKNKEE